MNEKVPNELLSAYLDGELALSERAEVERLLQASTEFRRELDEIGQLSEMLRSLPKEPAPQELASSVLHQAEREALLPVSQPAKVATFSVRSWGVAVAGVVATVAAVVVMVHFVSSPNHLGIETADTMHPGDAEVATPPVSSAEADLEVANAERNTVSLPKTVSRQTDAAGGEAGKTVSTRPAIESDSAAAARPAASMAVPSGKDSRSLHLAKEAPAKPAAGKSFEKLSTIAPSKSPLKQPQVVPTQIVDLKTVRPGQVIHYFQGSGDQVSVVEVTVVDVQKALGAVQVLLAKNAVPLAVDESAGSRAAKAGRKTDELSNSLFAVYVEATGSQLASTLGEMKLQKELFVDLKLKPPVDMDRIGVAVKTVSSTRGRLERMEKKKKTVAASSRQSAARKMVKAESDAPAVAEKPLFGRKRPENLRSFQLNVKISDLAFTAPRDHSRRRFALGERANRPEPARKLAESLSQPSDKLLKRVRVMFVFQTLAGGPKPK